MVHNILFAVCLIQTCKSLSRETGFPELKFTSNVLSILDFIESAFNVNSVLSLNDLKLLNEMSIIITIGLNYATKIQ